MSQPDDPRKPPDAGAEPRQSPWRVPVVWLVIALPAAVVVASIAMLFIASGDGNDQVIDTVSRRAQIQTADLAPDEVAQRGKYSALVRIDAEGGFIEALPVNGDFDRGAPLRLTLAHPTQAAADRVLELQPTETGWRADAGVDGGNDWKLQLEPLDGHWRLKGRLPRGQLAINLRPTLQGD